MARVGRPIRNGRFYTPLYIARDRPQTQVHGEVHGKRTMRFLSAKKPGADMPVDAGTAQWSS